MTPQAHKRGSYYVPVINTGHRRITVRNTNGHRVRFTTQQQAREFAARQIERIEK